MTSQMPKNAPLRPSHGQLASIVRWPTERWPEGIGISVKDGWNFGIGFGVAMAIAVPLILALLGCVVGIGITVLGNSLGSLL